VVSHLFRAGSLSLLLIGVASAQTPGGEFRVNTYTTSSQSGSSLAMEPDGDFVVVWQSYVQDGSYSGVFGQRFAASGAARGGEFRLNTDTTGRQVEPAVAVGSSGDFVVVWQSGDDGSTWGIRGRRFDAAGSAIGVEFQVNTYTTFDQEYPHVGRASDGRFVVTWGSRSDDSGYGIAARRFDASGNPTGSEFVVNTYTTGGQYFGDLAVEANGNFVAVWEDFVGNRDGSGSAIFGQRFDASGTRLGSEFQANSYTTGSQRVPSISLSPAGGFVVTWFGRFGDGGGYETVARRFDASGAAAGNDFVVNMFTTGSQVFGRVAHDGAGNFVVTWQGLEAGYSSGTFAQSFDASGVRRGAEFWVNSYTTGAQTFPSVASDSAGNFVVVWQSDGQDGSGYGVFAQRFDIDLIFGDGFDPSLP
jgi:hypothetical protein